MIAASGALGSRKSCSAWAGEHAWEQVKENRGAAGVDGVSIAAFEKDLKRNLFKIWNRMSSGSYFAPPVRLVEIPKANGGVRPLGIPTIADRVAQTVVQEIASPCGDTYARGKMRLPEIARKLGAAAANRPAPVRGDAGAMGAGVAFPGGTLPLTRARARSLVLRRQSAAYRADGRLPAQATAQGRHPRRRRQGYRLPLHAARR